jgi:hypothetical protein
MTSPARATTAARVFRWDGAYWGFTVGDVLYDRYGHSIGWIEGTEVFHFDGHFLGELRDGEYVLRDELREDPIPRAPRPVAPYLTPPDPLPARAARAPVEGWRDALPWPLSPPDPPTR